MAFLIPIIVFYTLGFLSLGAGLVACVGAFRSRCPRRWILVTGITTIIMGLWMNFYYQAVIWSPLGFWESFSSLEGAIWVIVLGLAPMILGMTSLIRWFLLRKKSSYSHFCQK